MTPQEHLEFLMESCRPILGDGLQFYRADGQCTFEVRTKEGKTEDFKIAYIIPKVQYDKLDNPLIPYYAIQIPNNFTTHSDIWKIVQAGVIDFIWKLWQKTNNEVDVNCGEFKSLNG